MTEAAFSERLLRWWQVHGRHDLPWQSPRTPYRVWISEIMLQQTQVSTVIPYFARFMQRFPDLPVLANADLDEVLALWTGLGYYARARNIHASARLCVSNHGSQLPASPTELTKLPGIGRSTANAIYAQAWNKPAVILDGNVKRVLSRHAAIDGWPGRTAVEKSLWAEAEQRTPQSDAANYTQAIMDLGATLCTSSSPRCQDCPVSSDCMALNADRVAEFPGKKPRKSRPHKRARMLVLRNSENQVLMIRRPPSGIWGGLWSFPEQADGINVNPDSSRPALSSIDHEFSHFKLNMVFLHRDADPVDQVFESGDWRWIAPEKALNLGLPQPIKTVIEGLIR